MAVVKPLTRNLTFAQNWGAGIGKGAELKVSDTHPQISSFFAEITTTATRERGVVVMLTMLTSLLLLF